MIVAPPRPCPDGAPRAAGFVALTLARFYSCCLDCRAGEMYPTDLPSWLALCHSQGLRTVGMREGADFTAVILQTEGGWTVYFNRAAPGARQCAAICHELAEYILAAYEYDCPMQAELRRRDIPLGPWRHDVANEVVGMIFGACS